MEILTTMQAARIFDCSPENVRALDKKGALHAIRIGAGVRQRLFDRKEVEALARARTNRVAKNDRRNR